MEDASIRSAHSCDLQKINQVIQSAVMNWPMPDRVKRLAVPVLQYHQNDLDFYEVLVANYKDEVAGVAAWDSMPSQSLPNGKGGVFHGLYVLPLVQRQGIGKQLMDTVFDDARTLRSIGLLIKSQRVSRHFFERHRMQSLDVNEDEYPWQYWKQLA